MTSIETDFSLDTRRKPKTQGCHQKPVAGEIRRLLLLRLNQNVTFSVRSWQREVLSGVAYLPIYQSFLLVFTEVSSSTISLPFVSKQTADFFTGYFSVLTWA